MRLAPTWAKAIFCPWATLGAPHTTWWERIFTHVHGAQHQAVGVGVTLDLLNKTDEAVLPTADGDDVAHFQTCHGQTVGQVSGRHVEVDEFS